jgi:hypothetical protein
MMNETDNSNGQQGFCQYTKGCTFGWKKKSKICTTKVVFLQFGCMKIALSASLSQFMPPAARGTLFEKTAPLDP